MQKGWPTGSVRTRALSPCGEGASQQIGLATWSSARPRWPERHRSPPPCDWQQSGRLDLVEECEGFGGVRAHEALQTGRHDLYPPAGPCPHLFLEGADARPDLSDRWRWTRRVRRLPASRGSRPPQVGASGGLRHPRASPRRRGSRCGTRAGRRGGGERRRCSFATGLDWVLDAVAAKLTRPSA
jgi:hypothetical protein